MVDQYPDYLVKAINKLKSVEGMGGTPKEIAWCELQSEINVAETSFQITPEEAWDLREKYLGLERC